jgi:hypothetical protein
MPAASSGTSTFFPVAWYALLTISVIYIGIGAVLRRGTRWSVRVTRYEPPKGISPAVAAFLNEGGRSERAFAAAIISLATKGYMKILQKADWITLDKLRDADSWLPAEESTVLFSVFPDGTQTYSFNAGDSSRLFAAFRDFRATVHDAATPELMSTHVVLWLVGFTYSGTVLELLLFDSPGFTNSFSAGSVAFLILVIIVGGSCFVAALRAWPNTLLKLRTYFPESRRQKRPLNLNDATPLFLTATALFGFIFLSILTSTQFAAITAAALAMNVFSRHLLNAPTSAGRAALLALWEFREFLVRADADRMNVQNEPGKTPHTLEPYTSYAVALGVEKGWGEEFAGNLLELLQADQAYSPPGVALQPDHRPSVLTLFDRDK